MFVNFIYFSQVLLGGGRRAFYPANYSDPETGSTTVNKRNDGNNLVEEWLNIQKEKNRKHKFVWKKEDFDSIDVNDVDYVLGERMMWNRRKTSRGKYVKDLWRYTIGSLCLVCPLKFSLSIPKNIGNFLLIFHLCLF